MKHETSFSDMTGMTSKQFAAQEAGNDIQQSLSDLAAHLNIDEDELTAAYERGL